MSNQLSPKQFKRLALKAQGILGKSPFGKGAKGVSQALDQLGYLQIDPIAVCARSYHHVLWSRIEGYRPELLEKHIAERTIVEYWSHAAAYLPMKDYRFCLPKMAEIRARGYHWFKCDPNLMEEILAQIRGEGPQQSKNFASTSKRTGTWKSPPVNRALHELFMRGDLMIVGRDGIQKIFELTERALPSQLDTRLPSQEEFGRFLIRRAIRAHGVVQEPEIRYLRKGLGPLLRELLAEMVSAGELITLDYNGRTYVTFPELVTQLGKRNPPRKLHLLNPFDNAIIQRKRIKELFNFEYQAEIYLAKHKRVYGHFALPILWGDDFVGRINPRADRKRGVLELQNVNLEPPFQHNDQLLHVLASALRSFAAFNHCDQATCLGESAHELELNRMIHSV